jgi:hypothetical protein
MNIVTNILSTVAIIIFAIFMAIKEYIPDKIMLPLQNFYLKFKNKKITLTGGTVNQLVTHATLNQKKQIIT